MAVTEQSYTGNGSTTNYSFTFPYLKSTDVQVQVDATVTTAWTFANATTVQFNTAPSNGAKIKILRKTNVDSLTATFYPGSAIKSEDLNDNYTQNLYSTQETSNRAFENTGGSITGNVTFGEDVTLTWEGATDNAHETTLTVADPTADRTITFPNVSGNVVTTGDTSTVNATMLADNAVDTAAIQDNAVTMAKLNSGALPTDITVASANIVNGTIVDADVGSGAAIAHTKLAGAAGGKVLLGNSSNVVTATTVSGDVTINNSGVTAITAGSILTADIADNQITSNKIANGTILTEDLSANVVNTDKLADNAVTSAKLASNAVTTERLNADAVTGAKIADDQINSEHYVDGSIDTVHIADLQVTTAKIAADAITGAKIADDAINSEHYTDASIRDNHIQDSNITTSKIASNAVTTAKIAADAITSAKLADNSVDSEHYVDGSINTINLAGSAVTNAKLADNAVTTAKIVNDAVTADKIADAVIVTNSEQASASVNDTTFFTTSASDARYFNISSGDTIKDGQSFPDNDTTIATTAAINDRIIDLVDDVGGFVPIANETSFPNANPDVNNGTGTLVSIKALSSNLVSNGSGVATINNGTVGNSTVTINGLANSTTYNAGFGMIVETTSTLNTYSFHRQVPIATEVSTVAGSISNVNTVAGSISNVNAVAGNASNINAVAADASDIGAVAGKATEIGRLGTADAVADLALLGTADVVSDLNTLATSDIVSDMNTLATSANVTAMDNCSDDIANINTVAGSISNVNTTAGSISNVNTVASNISSVNDFAARYRIGSSNPTSSLDTGDLFFNTTANELKVYNGSAWQGGVTATGSFAVVTGNIFTGDNRYNDSVKAKFGTGSDLLIYHDGTNNVIDAATSANVWIKNNAASANEAMAGFRANGASELYYDGSKKLETQSDGVLVSGKIQANGHFYLTDNYKAQFGTSQDLQIYHNGTQSIIADTGTGPLLLQSNQFLVYNNDASELLIAANENGTAELYYDSSKKLETTSTGVKITGTRTDIDTGGTEDCLRIGNAAGCDTAIRLGSTGTNPDTHAVIKYDKDENWISLIVSGEAHGAGGILIENGGNVRLDDAIPHSDNTRDLGTSAIRWRDLYISNDIDIEDNGKLLLGDGDDLEIYHDGSHSWVHNDTGYLRLAGGGSGVTINNADNSEAMAGFIKNGSVDLYYDNAKKFETTSGGVNITGSITTDGLTVDGGSTFNGDTVFDGATAGRDCWWDRSANTLKFYDHAAIKLGNDDDLRIYHAAGSHSYIENTSGDLILNGNVIRLKDGGNNETLLTATKDGSIDLYYNNIKTFATTGGGAIIHGTEGGDANLHYYADEADDNADIWLTQAHTNGSFYLKNYTSGSYETNIKATGNGSVELYHNNTKKLETTSDGINVDGFVYATRLDLDDNEKILLGTGDDIQIYHDGSDSWIKNSTGVLVAATADFQVSNATGQEELIRATANGAVVLRYDNSNKFETTSLGVLASGRLQVNDGDSIYAGTGSDLRIHHTSDINYIDSRGRETRIRNLNTDGNATETMIKCVPNGSVELYYDNNKKLSTITNGVRIDNGDLLLDRDNAVIKLGASEDLKIYHDGTDNYWETTSGTTHFRVSNGNRLSINGSTGDVSMQGASGKNFLWDTSAAFLNLNDNATATYGTGDDLRIYHDGSHSNIVNHTNYLYHGSTQHHFQNAALNELQAVFKENSSVDLYFDHSKKFETTTYGALVSGHFVATGLIDLADGNGSSTATIALGNDDDMKLFHDGSNNHIYCNGAHGLIFTTNNNYRAYFTSDGHFLPWANNTYDLGSTSNRWRNIYTNDLNLSNEGSSNSVDGTWGDWTIQEGESDLFLKNNRSGKKYKFNLTEVS